VARDWSELAAAAGGEDGEKKEGTVDEWAELNVACDWSELAAAAGGEDGEKKEGTVDEWAELNVARDDCLTALPGSSAVDGR